MRILAGTYKGRRLLSPPVGSETRPITGAAKKSLFDMLAGSVPGAAVVDLYCGTGSLGLEALSRGARTCAFADRDRRVLGRLRRNIEAVGATEACDVWPGDVTKGLARRLAGLGENVQVLAVTHAPQVAALASGHLRITKEAVATSKGEAMTTRVAVLNDAERREEVARMLAGQTITDEARAAADRLMRKSA